MLQELDKHVVNHPYPLVFATVSGAHLYGFPSHDSDYDLRGMHVLPLEEVIGLGKPRETVDRNFYDGETEIDLVTHDVKKFFGLLLKKNGYVLEQVFSDHIVKGSAAHDELCEIAQDCVTRYHAYHYLGFAATQWKLYSKEAPRRAKPLLYVFRVLLTGIHLMRTGVVEANLCRLNEEARLSYIDDLIARKTSGPEYSVLPESDEAFYRYEYDRLTLQLEEACRDSHLPEATNARPALHDLLIRIRKNAA